MICRTIFHVKLKYLIFLQVHSVHNSGRKSNINFPNSMRHPWYFAKNKHCFKTAFCSSLCEYPLNHVVHQTLSKSIKCRVKEKPCIIFTSWSIYSNFSNEVIFGVQNLNNSIVSLNNVSRAVFSSVLCTRRVWCRVYLDLALIFLRFLFSLRIRFFLHFALILIQPERWKTELVYTKWCFDIQISIVFELLC